MRPTLEHELASLPRSERRLRAGLEAALAALEAPNFGANARLVRGIDDEGRTVPLAAMRLGGVEVSWPATGGQPTVHLVP